MQQIQLRQRIKILLIENAPGSNILIRSLLQPLFDVQPVADAAAGLVASESWQPDIVITSVTVAEQENLSLLRMAPALRDTPMVLLSTQAQILEPTDNPGIEFDDYIEQPVTGSELAARIHATVNGARIRTKNNARYRFLIDLNDATRTLINPDDIILTAATLLGRHLAVNRCAYADVEADQDTFNLTGNYNHDVFSIVGRYRFAQFGAECLRLMQAGLPYVVADCETDTRITDVVASYRQTLIRAVVCVPLMKGGRLVAAMAVHQKTPRTWRTDEVELLLMVANRCWESIERARVTRELHNNEARYRTLVETISAVVWRTDQDGAIGSENPSWAAFTGQAFEQYRGWGWLDAVHPDDHAGLLDAWRTAIAARQPYQHTYRLRRHDGQYRDVNARGAPLSTSDSNQWEWIGNCVDVTEARHAQAALQEAAARLQFTLESARVGDWDLDLVNDTSRRSLRHDQCFGYHEPIPDWGFEKFIQHVHSEDRERVSKEFHDAVSNLQDWHFECRVVWPDASVHWIAAHGSIYRVDGKPMHMLGIVFDITERKKNEEQLRETDRRKDEFLAMLAHELRNPLAPIGAAADLLSLVQIDETSVRKTSAVISRQVRHMTSLVDDLLDVSRVTRGLISLERVALDAKRIVADAVEQVRPLIEARHHHLAVHMPPESAFILGDAKRLVQALGNLLNNAAKYTPEGGNIMLHLEVHGAQVTLTVTDNGIGMAPELTERVFELFVQAERTSDRSQGGLGLGLALVKSLIELHGGNVSAHSGGIGAGSEFMVRLPRVAKAAVAGASQDDMPVIKMPEKKLRLMIVDDNADAASMLAMFLNAAGHEVMVEHEPRKALERARMERPDVCLLDIGLPDMNGNELAQQIRLQPETAQSLLIAITGYGQDEDKKKALAAGFTHYFVKPVDTAKLSALLGEISEE